MEILINSKGWYWNGKKVDSLLVKTWLTAVVLIALTVASFMVIINLQFLKAMLTLLFLFLVGFVGYVVAFVFVVFCFVLVGTMLWGIGALLLQPFLLLFGRKGFYSREAKGFTISNEHAYERKEPV